MTDYRMPAAQCPYCEVWCNGAYDGDGIFEQSKGGPRPGDVTVCINCASPLVLDNRLRLRKPTAQELEEIYRIPEIQAAIGALAAMYLADKKQ